MQNIYNINVTVTDNVPEEEIEFHINNLKELLLQREKINIDQILPIILFYYTLPLNGAGGSLHIVLDDGNVDDGHIEYCIKRANEKGDELGVYLGKALLTMSKTQRRKIYRKC